MPRVYNRHHKDAPPDAVYCGYGTPWGNIYTHLELTDPRHSTLIKVATRDEACDRFDEDVENNPELKQIIKVALKGKDLLCSCYPLRCHCDTLLRVANEE